jgi:hypothetical protein
MPPAVRALAAELLPSAPELARGLTDHLLANVPELSGAGDDALREETRASVEGNVDQVLRLLKLGAGADALVVPPDAAEFVRGLVRRGITLAVLLRTYRLGHGWFWDVWREALTERVADRRLGYGLQRHHVALRLTSGVAEVRGLERAATEAAARLGPGAPLVVLSGAASLDVWCGAFEAPSVDGLEEYRPPAGVRVAFGAPAYGGRRLPQLARRGPPGDAHREPRAGRRRAGHRPSASISCRSSRPISPGRVRSSSAKELHVHQNTVAYRVKRAEELVGRRTTERPIELICALALAAALGEAVLFD